MSAVCSRERARAIVKMAAKKAEDLDARGIASWLTLDERGSWEAMATREVGRIARVVEERPELRMEEADANEAIADVLLLAAVDVTLRAAKRQKARG